MKIIMVSGAINSGKDTFYEITNNILKKNIKTKKFAFADSLKRIARKVGWNGSKNKEGRWFLIDVGQILKGEYVTKNNNFHAIYDLNSKTNVYRNTYDIVNLYKNLLELYTPNKNFWADIVAYQIFNSNADYNIITDWRFINEYYCLLKYFDNDDIIRIKIESSPYITVYDNDISENSISNDYIQHIIYNLSTIDDYKKEIKNFIDNKLTI